MWTVYEPWQVAQLQRLAAADPERAETLLNTLWKSFPELLAELALAAVDQEQLSVAHCASMLDITPQRVEELLVEHRMRGQRSDKGVVFEEGNHVAKLAEGGVAVWEVIRVFRRLGSVERLSEAFPGISRAELAAALRYAEKNPSEIEDLISRYEEMRRRRDLQYPFAR